MGNSSCAGLPGIMDAITCDELQLCIRGWISSLAHQLAS